MDFLNLNLKVRDQSIFLGVNVLLIFFVLSSLGLALILIRCKANRRNIRIKNLFGIIVISCLVVAFKRINRTVHEVRVVLVLSQARVLDKFRNGVPLPTVDATHVLPQHQQLLNYVRALPLR